MGALNRAGVALRFGWGAWDFLWTITGMAGGATVLAVIQDWWMAWHPYLQAFFFVCVVFICGFGVFLLQDHIRKPIRLDLKISYPFRSRVQIVMMNRSRRDRFFVQITRVLGSLEMRDEETQDRPTAPWSVRWRDSDEERIELTKGEEKLLDVAHVTLLDGENARIEFLMPYGRAIKIGIPKDENIDFFNKVLVMLTLKFTSADSGSHRIGFMHIQRSRFGPEARFVMVEGIQRPLGPLGR